MNDTVNDTIREMYLKLLFLYDLRIIKRCLMCCKQLWIYRPLGYERVYLRLCKVADAPFHIQGDELSSPTKLTSCGSNESHRYDTL